MGRITGPARAKALEMVCLKYCAFLLLLNGVAIPVTERVAYAAPSAISRMSPATSARPVEDNEKAPPPPDGYEVLPDDDEIEITRWSPNMPPPRPLPPCLSMHPRRLVTTGISRQSMCLVFQSRSMHLSCRLITARLPIRPMLGRQEMVAMRQVRGVVWENHEKSENVNADG
jgi:hypothetical protein